MVIVDKSMNEAESITKNIAESLHSETDGLKEWALIGDLREVTSRIETYNHAGVSYDVLNFSREKCSQASLEGSTTYEDAMV